jgi:hypothetical protein
MKSLGEGTSGKVFLAKRRHSAEDLVAIKILDVRRMIS